VPVSEAVPHPVTKGKPACDGIALPVFFTNSPRRRDQAERVCGTCPIRMACDAYAMAYDVQGYWAGSTYSQRQSRRAELGVQPIPILIHAPRIGQPEKSKRSRAPRTPRPEQIEELPVELPDLTPADVAPAAPVEVEVISSAPAALAETVSTKTCPRCRTPRPHAEFHKSPGTPDGLAPWCKPCFRQTAHR
jgi:hypothetical protein